MATLLLEALHAHGVAAEHLRHAAAARRSVTRYRCSAKLARLRQMIDAEGREIDLEVDGGIKVGTARAVCEAGADALVAGNAIFAGGDYARAITAIRDDARGVTRTGAEA
jgi:3-keto-L-gulonate-6-phosphate decarboxylase